MKHKIYNLIIFSSILTLFISNNSLAQMFWNQACSFAGTTSSYITRGNSASLNIAGSFSFEAWLNPVNSTTPTSQTIIQKREGANANGYTMYLSSGRVAIRTNSATRLVGQTVLPNNVWTHVAGTYNSVTNAFNVYINGTLDTNIIIAGAAPVASTDSLYIGKGFNDPYAGQIDEVRIWNRQLSSTEVLQYRRTTLGTNTGVYNGLVMSMTFQDNDANGSAFVLTDWSGNNNNGINRGASGVDLSNRPLQTIAINDCVELNGNNEYLAVPDASQLSPTSEITIEVWIFPRSVDKNNIIIHKGLDDGTITDYNLSLLDGRLNATINNISKFTSDDLIPLNQWSHVAFTYDGPNGVYAFYLNGHQIDVGINDKGFIIDGPDSLYIGGTIGLTDFDGYIDEVRIADAAKSQNQINRFLFKSIDESNDLPAVEAVYNLDGYAVSSVSAFNRFYFRNSANFSHCGTTNKPVSPMNRADDLNLEDGYLLKTSDRRIPASGTIGSMTNDTLDVYLNEVINDINIFIGLNQNVEQQLNISIVAPNGESVELFHGNNLVPNAGNIITIFDDQADSSMVNGRYVSFSPVIRPVNNMNSIFSGDNTSGKWRLVIDDVINNDTGRLYGWGIQFNSRTSKSTTLSSASLIQGFYNSSTNLMIRDTMRFYMRHTSAPYNIIDSARSFLSANGSATVTFNNIINGDLYFIQLKHRNSIETWSNSGIVFDPLTSQASFDFTTSASQSFGDNMIQVDNSPNEFAIYGADVNQDGSVDLTDLTLIDNDGFSFVSGYVLTDVNGDNAVDLSDATIADNNAFNFVSKVIP